MQTPTFLPTAAGRSEPLSKARSGLRASGLDTRLAGPLAGMCPVGAEERLSQPRVLVSLGQANVFPEHITLRWTGVEVPGRSLFRDSWDSSPQDTGL